MTMNVHPFVKRNQATLAEPQRIEGWFDGEHWHQHRKSSLLESWPERAIAACWAIGLLAASALFVATMWWLTA